MRFADIVAYSLKNLRQNKGRTIATMVGVVLGTLLVVLIVAIGNGANKSIMDSMEQNTNLMLINVYPYYGGGEESGQPRVTKLTDTTLAQIRALEGVEAVTPMTYVYLGMEAYLINGKYEMYSSFTAVDMEAFSKFVELSEGRVATNNRNKVEFLMSPVNMVEFRDPDDKNYEWVDVYTLLQNDEEIPLPRINWLNSPFTLRFRYYDYSVVTETNPTPEEHTFELDARMTGIIKPDKNDFTFSYGTYVDIKWVKQFIKDNKKLLEDLGSVPKLDSYDNVYVKARSVDEVSTVLKGLNELGVQYSSPMQWIEELRASTNKTQMFLMFIAMFTMLASIMSIYNTISMSVQERKREIGIMKVLGCGISRIRAMFLSEAMMIGFGGGLMGLVLSFLLAQLINNVPAIGALLSQLMGASAFGSGGLSAIITPELALMTWLGAILVSVLSGYIPANRATRMSAQEAIRSVG